MAQPKHLGGLGFKNLEDYNDSLLAKLSWRIFSKPESLLARVLKGKYFPDSSIMESYEKSGSSHGWTNIMAGKAVLDKGVGYLVGNGNVIRVWSDPWLSTIKPFVPIGPPTFANQNLLVKDLLDQCSNDWDLEKIRLHLPHYEEDIRLLIPGSSKPKDRQVWLPDSSGEYSSKSGYKKIFAEKNAIIHGPFDWMKCVRKLHIPPKIRHFLWRLLNNALPVVGSLLATRGVQSEINCKRCGEAESIAHLFLECPFAENLWEKAPIVQLGVAGQINESMKEWLSRVVNFKALPPIGLSSSPLIPWFLWNLWTARNKLVFEGTLFQVEDIISKTVVEAKDWELANCTLEKKQKPNPGARNVLVNAPSCWMGGAWQESTRIVGMWWIIKNETGEVLCRGSTNQPFVCSALMAEALAICEALSKAKDFNLRSLQLFSDSQVLVSALRSELEVNEIAGVLHDIRNLATLFCPLSFRFIPRLENRQADALASSGLERFNGVNVV
ncbi:unnamed protein product [Brassica oleracea]